jgi:outer membrane biosynthesis protein TonB
MAGGPHKPGSTSADRASGVPAPGEFEGDDLEATHVSDELPLSAAQLGAPAKPPAAPHRTPDEEADDASSEQLPLPPDLTGAQAPLRPRPVEAELTGGHAPLRPSLATARPLSDSARSSPLSGPPPGGAFAPAMALPGGRAVYRSELDAPERTSARGPVLLAAGLHAALIVSALVVPKLFGGPAPLRKPIIARLVAQGKPRDQKLMPRKEEPPPPPAAAPRSAPDLGAPPAPAARSTPAKAPPAAAPKPRAPSREELMQKALASVSASPDRERSKAPPEERECDTAGSPDGTAATAEEGDLYFAKVQAEILSHYTIPSIISERERMALKAVIVAWIAPDGKLVRYQFDRRSGNAQFDSALERAIKASRIPAPPPERAKAIRDEGVALEFTP